MIEIVRLMRQFAWVVVFGLYALAPPANAVVPDPGVADPARPVTKEIYTFGDQVFLPSPLIPVQGVAGFDFRVEVTGSVHYPTDLSGGPFPLVVFQHGSNWTCGAGQLVPYEFGLGLAFPWPCSPTQQVTLNYDGYDYIAEVLASHGYIVVSTSANGVEARRHLAAPSEEITNRSELMQEHLDKWQVFNTTDDDPLFDFGGRFIGKVDLNNVGTMGHSKGGYALGGQIELNESLGSPYGMQAILALAAFGSESYGVDNVNSATILAYCDGQIRNLSGVKAFDEFRYNLPGDLTSKHVFSSVGSNHNYFNSIWTLNGDDWTGSVPGPFGSVQNVFNGQSNPHCSTSQPTNERLTSAEQESFSRAYIAGFFRYYLGGESDFAEMLRGDTSAPPSVLVDDIHVSYHGPAPARLDVNSTLDASSLTLNDLGATVSQSGLAEYGFCGVDSSGATTPCSSYGAFAREIHRFSSGTIQLSWDAGGASYTNALPASAADLTGFRTLQFRASVDPSDSRNPVGAAQDFRITLVDALGAEKSVFVSSRSDGLYYPPGEFVGIRAHLQPVPHLILNGVRVPLSDFQAGVDLTDIASIRFDFDNPSGALLVADLALSEVNTAPVADAGVDQSISCTSSMNTTVILDGSLTTDADGDTVALTWAGPFGSISGIAPSVQLPVGVHQIQLTATDPFGAQSTSSVEVSITGDADGDLICDVEDNCSVVANATQTDADSDGYGNSCDADLDQDGVTAGSDFIAFLGCYGAGVPAAGGPAEDPTCEESDLDDDGVVAGTDWILFLGLYGGIPGPSGLVCADPTINVANGDAPCP